MDFLPAFLAVAALTAVTAQAQSSFDGNWKAKTEAAQFDKKPTVVTIIGGTYRCSSCSPAFAVPADGKFHAITGHPYVDSVAITVVNAATYVEHDRKGAKLMYEDSTTVSSDGKTATDRFKDFSAPNGKVISGQQIFQRVGPAPAGAHAASGSWQAGTVSGVTDAGLRFSLQTRGDQFRYSDQSGVTYTGTFGGAPAKVVGDPAGTMNRVERLNATTLRVTGMRAGKPVSVSTITVSADGRTLHNTSRDLVHGTTNKLVAVRE